MKNKTEIQIYESTPVNIKKAAWMSLSRESQSAYSHDYKLFFNFVKKDAKDVTASDVLRFIEYLEKNNYKNSSINRKTASLSKFFKVMVMAKEITINPIDVLKQFKKISRPVDKSINISLTLQDIKTTIKIDKNSNIQERKMSLIIKTLAMTGLRISEFINIKNCDITDFDNENQIISIIGKGRKERKIYLENDFIKEIKTIYPEKKEMPYLFYTLRMHKYNRKVLYKQINEKFKDKIGKNVHPHLLRHHYITHKISIEKLDIKAVSHAVGHSDVSTTLNMYVDTKLSAEESQLKI